MSRPPAPSRRLLAAALALLAGGCARQAEVTVVVASTPLLDRARMDAAPKGEAPMGKRLVVKVPRFGKKPFWAVKGEEAWVAADDVAAFPIEGAAAFATVEGLQVLRPDGGVEKELRLGTPLRTFSNPALEARKVVAIVDGGVVIGFCDPAGVSPEKPSPALFAQRVQELARAGDFAAATRFVDAGLAAYPGDPGLKPWVDVLHRAADPLVFPPPGQRASVPPEPPPQAGAAAWVAPLAAAVLASARPDAKPVTVLRQNTPLRVVEIAGPYAKVKLADTGAVAWAAVEGSISLLPDRVPEGYRAPPAADGAAAVTPAATTSGNGAAYWVRVVDLQGAPSTEESLVARARKAQAEGAPDESLELLSRALAFGGAAPETYEQLFDAAIAAGDVERAVWAALLAKGRPAPKHALRGIAGWSAPAIVDVALVRGCTAPLQPDGGLDVADMGAALHRPRAGQCLVTSGSPVVCEDCRVEDAAAAAQKLERQTRANERFAASAGELYPQGPYLRITLANTSAVAGPPREPLLVTYGKTYWVPILALGAYERVTVYVKVDTTRDVYGVSLGEENPGEPDGDEVGAFVIQSPEYATVWVGAGDPECVPCERSDGRADPADDGAVDAPGTQREYIPDPPPDDPEPDEGD